MAETSTVAGANFSLNCLAISSAQSDMPCADMIATLIFAALAGCAGAAVAPGAAAGGCEVVAGTQALSMPSAAKPPVPARNSRRETFFLEIVI